MKLYWFWSTNPQKARWALEELGLDYELIEVDLGRREQTQDAFLAINPRGQVPVLVDGDLTITQSNGILCHLGETTKGLWPGDAAGRAEAWTWLFFEASAFQMPAGTLWFGETIAPHFGGTLDERKRARAVERLEKCLKHLEATLSRQPWLLGSFSLVDCAFGPWLAGLDQTSFDLAPYEGVTRYLAACRAREAWKRCDFRY